MSSLASHAVLISLVCGALAVVYGLADIGYAPWVLRAQERLEVELDGFAALAEWVERLSARPAIGAERELAAARC